LRDSVFGKLLRQFGDEQFAGFWRSESPVDSAFRAAFGLEIGTWVYADLLATWGPPPPWRIVWQREFGLTVLVVALLFLIGAIRIQRRQVE